MVSIFESKQLADPTGSRARLEKLKATVGNFDKVPMIPEAAAKAMAVLNNPECFLGDLADVIKQDPVLTMGILKLANSALYHSGQTISCIEPAIVRLGIRECRNLIFAVSMRSLFRNIGKSVKEKSELIWKHSLVTACLCRRLNECLRLGFKGEEFSCGLSHDIGRLLFAITVPDLFGAADPVDFREAPDLLSREREMLGSDHCFFGAWFATVNQLPSTLIDVIQFHHTLAESANNQTLVALVGAADHMANYLAATPEAPYEPNDNPAWLFLLRDTNETEKARLSAALPAIMAAAAEEAENVNA